MSSFILRKYIILINFEIFYTQKFVDIQPNI